MASVKAVTTWKPESSQYTIKAATRETRSNMVSAALDRSAVPLVLTMTRNKHKTESNKGSTIHDNSNEELFNSFWSLWSAHQCFQGYGKDFHFGVNKVAVLSSSRATLSCCILFWANCSFASNLVVCIGLSFSFQASSWRATIAHQQNATVTLEQVMVTRSDLLRSSRWFKRSCWYLRNVRST